MSKDETESWMQTALTNHKKILEWLYRRPIQDVVRTIMAKEVSNLSPADQADYEQWALEEANKNAK